MPTTGSPASKRRRATASVSSPPRAITPSSPRRSTFVSTSLDRSRFGSLLPEPQWKGFVRDAPRRLPPSRYHVRTSARSRVHAWSTASSRSPAQPSHRPTTSTPSSAARYTAPRIAAFTPGASPPPTRMPSRRSFFAFIMPPRARARGPPTPRGRRRRRAPRARASRPRGAPAPGCSALRRARTTRRARRARTPAEARRA
jgi:hypothetical protein